MRPLFCDFASDTRVWNMTDEFMFGRHILAAPIVEAQYTQEQIVKEDAMTGWDRKQAKTVVHNQQVEWTAPKTAVKYLPKGTLWYDFWTNKTYQGGRNVTLQTSIDRVPMFVRAGTILPLASEMQYVGEKSWDQLELRIYPGADGDFTLYEDEGDSYRYEQGLYSTISFHWDNSRRLLTIGARQGNYPGMLEKRMFTIVFPDGITKAVEYDGHKLEVRR